MRKLKTKMFKKLEKKKKAKREFFRNLSSNFDNVQISWIAPERMEHERGKLWFFLVLVSVIAAVAWGLMSNAWTFSLAIVVFAIVYYIFDREKSQEVEIIISDIGIKVGGRRYPFSRIKAFWIIYEPPFTKALYIRVSDDLAADIDIQLNEQDPAEVREFLMEKIPEVEGKQQSISELFAKLLKI